MSTPPPAASPPAPGAAAPAAAAAAAASTPPAPAPRAAPSLAAWKSGADKMTTAAAGDHVSKTAPKPKPAAKKAAAKAPSAPAKPWVEQSLAERYGSQPKLVNLSKQLKDVLRYLEGHQERGCISWDEVTTHGIPPWYDTSEGGELFNLLTTNPRVIASARGFAYQSEHGVADRASLLAHIRSRPGGVRSSDIKDGYDNVLADADALHGEGLVYRFYNPEFKVDVFFPVPPVPPAPPASAELGELFIKTALPAEPSELIAGVTKLGLRSALASATSSRKPVSLVKAERPKKKRKLNLRHVTNTHMVHILNDTQFTSID